MDEATTSIARAFPTEAMWLRVVLVIVFMLFVVGILAPIITLEKFYFFENRVSIVSGLSELVSEGQWLLFVLIGLFSLVLPVLKLVFLSLLLLPFHRQSSRQLQYLQWMHLYGKWSMLDVFVVAVLIATVKLGAVASVQLHYGLYAFAGAVLLTMALTGRVVQLANRLTAK